MTSFISALPIGTDSSITQRCSLYKHGVLLNSIRLDDRLSLSAPLPLISDTNRVSNDLDLKYADLCATTLNATDSQSKEKTVKLIYDKLKHAGFITKEGQVRRQVVSESIFTTVSSLSVDHPYFLPSKIHDYNYLRNILNPKEYTHPGRLCVFLFWLSEQKQHSTIIKLTSPQKNRDKNKVSLEEKCIRYLKAGESLNKTAQLVGKSRCFVKSVALRHNITSSPEAQTNNSRHETGYFVVGSKRSTS